MSDLKATKLDERSSRDARQPPNEKRRTPGPSLGGTAKTIAWSFFGIRRRGDHEQATPRINPIHIVVAGFVGVFLLVAGLIVLVNLVVAT
jgi:hypothetical protein